MSNEDSKLAHGRRLQQKNRHIARQVRIRQANKLTVNSMHRYHKTSGMTCGRSNCIMCGNPRKFLKELTIQEKRFDQPNLDSTRNKRSNGAVLDE
jgi:hypothetical protein